MQKTNTGTLKCKKQALCFSTYIQLRARLHNRNIGSSGKLWNDNDFRGCKRDGFCGKIIDLLENNQSDANGETSANSEVGIFCAWF